MIWRTLLGVLVLSIAPLVEAAPPRARAVVAVALAVDELLQSNTPALPDTLDNGERSEREDVTPQPHGTPCDCPAKCGKIGCNCQKVAAVVSAKPVLVINDAALEAAGAQGRKRLLVTIYSPMGWVCPPCEAMKAQAKREGWEAGDADIELAWRTENPPHVTAFPWIECGDRNIRGQRDIGSIRAWLNLPAVKVAQAVGSVTVGTINGAAIRAALAQLQPAGKSSVIKLEGASITVPPSVSIDLSASSERVAIRFPGSTKPRLGYGSGWLSASQPINAFTVTGDVLTVGLDGWPDLSFRVE